jgi:uncharacterized caspase-like protein
MRLAEQLDFMETTLETLARVDDALAATRPAGGAPVAQRGDRPASAPVDPKAWLQAQLDEYVAAVGTLRPRVSEAKALLEEAAAIRQDEYVPLEGLAEAEQLEAEALAKLRRAADQRRRMARIFDGLAAKLSTADVENSCG